MYTLKQFRHLKKTLLGMQVSTFTKKTVLTLLDASKRCTRPVYFTLSAIAGEHDPEHPVACLNRELRDVFNVLNHELRYMGLYTLSYFPGSYDKEGHYNTLDLVKDGGRLHRCTVCFMKTETIDADTHQFRTSEKAIRKKKIPYADS